jgi:hypothetical protein
MLEDEYDSLIKEYKEAQKLIYNMVDDSVGDQAKVVAMFGLVSLGVAALMWLHKIKGDNHVPRN